MPPAPSTDAAGGSHSSSICSRSAGATTKGEACVREKGSAQPLIPLPIVCSKAIPKKEGGPLACPPFAATIFGSSLDSSDKPRYARCSSGATPPLRLFSYVPLEGRALEESFSSILHNYVLVLGLLRGYVLNLGGSLITRSSLETQFTPMIVCSKAIVGVASLFFNDVSGSAETA